MTALSQVAPSLALAGAVAVAASDPDAGVAWHFGDPFAEQRAWHGGRGVADLSYRAVLRIPGSDRLRWLHDLTTQHLTQLPAHQATETLLLDPRGHVEDQLLGVDDGTAFWMHVEPGRAAPLLDFLTRMRFMLDVDVVDLSSQRVVVALGADVEIPAWLAGDPQLVVRRCDTALPWRGTELLVLRPDAQRLVADGERPVGSWALEAERVAARRPRLGLETDHRTIPNEVGWLDTAVHLDKGCYRGQETVAKVHNLGRPPRRLVLLHLDGPQVLPAPGSDVLLGERAVGFLGRVAHHFELGPIALALVKRGVSDDAVLTVTDSDGEQVAASIDPGT